MNQPDQPWPSGPAIPAINGDCWSMTLSGERHDPE